MLIVDPDKRLSIDDVIKHEWMTLSGEDPEFDELIERYCNVVDSSQEPLNEYVLSQMSSMAMDREQTIMVRCFLSDNSITGTFFSSVR